MIDYTWVAWFEELTAKIAEGGEGYLIERARNVAWQEDGREGVPALLLYGDENIDPFSFLYFLAHKNTRNQYERVFESVHEKFGIGSDFPETAFIPTPTRNLLFHGGQNTFNPEVLWRLYRQAVRIDVEPAIQPEDFNAALGIYNVGIPKLTQTLFIANPRYFLPADRGMLAVLPEHEDVNDYEGYVAVMEDVRNRFPGCHPYEISAFLYTQANNSPLVSMECNFFQISTNVYNDGTDYWEWNDEWSEEDRDSTFNENNYVYTGGPGQTRIYPLAEPRRGDVILVRFGGQGRAIGVVERNGYDPDGWDETEVIQVHWINKMAAEVEGGLPQIGFSNAREPTCSAFRNTDAYKITFDLIDRWIGTDSVESPPEPEPPAEESDTSFPLNTILFGPPGTGKTWEAVSYAVAIMDDTEHAELVQAEDRQSIKARFEELREEERVEFVTFHQNYTYEDFIEGIVPVLKSKNLLYELRDGVFKRISSRAGDHLDERHVLIIDEINRGNIAKIFGELITLIEPSKRSDGEDEATVTLPYSQERFSVPDNLYLVGTMNTADRGIALLDTALRRRFDFIEKIPDLRLVEKNIKGVDGQAMLKAMNDRITVYLGRGHQIGHTYLIGVTTIDGLAEAFQRRIVPLLQEYFYDDWKKIRLVLNENPFIQREIETSIQDDRSERPVFELLAQDDDKWQKPESYRRIYADEQAEGSD